MLNFTVLRVVKILKIRKKNRFILSRFILGRFILGSIKFVVCKMVIF